jgi:hypothetical protein
MGEVRVVDKNRLFDAIAKLSEYGTEVTIYEYFLKHVQSAYEEDKKQEIIAQLGLLLKEKASMRRDKNHPFHGDEGGFDKYCRGKYKLLYGNIFAMIDNHLSQRR